MSAESSIEWTDATWNPVRGCTKVSPGCKHCYAETFAERFRGVPGHPYEQGFDLHMVADKLTDPLGWTKPKTIFVNSMSDMFHERVGLDFIGLAAKVMREADWHVFQLLTKRSARLASLPGDVGLMAPNLIVGVSVEDRKYGLPRIDDLRRAKVSRRFLSIEPLLEDLGEIDLDGIDWVIVGGESGPGARPMESRWARSIRDQCAAAGVPYREAFTSGLFRFSDFVSVLGPGGHVAGYTRFEGEAWARMYCERPEDEDGNPTGAAFAGGLDLDTVVLESLGAL